MMLTAAAAGQLADEGLIGASGKRHGVFTWTVLDALRKADSNGNGLIELSELVRHVQDVVAKVAADLGGKGRAATSEPEWGKQAARFDREARISPWRSAFSRRHCGPK